ncbi:MAG: NlpC/P60 family protein [Chitinophagaceae bacterium]
MQFVAVIVPAAPMRAEASHRSEMVSQLLFGEKAVVMARKGDFTKVKSLHDNYEGWVQTTQLTSVTKHFIQKKETGYVDKNGVIAYLNDTPMPLSVGTPIYSLRCIGQYKVRYKRGRKSGNDYTTFNAEAIQSLVMQYLNVGYLWGGRSSFGVDCSGLVQNVLKFFGKKLPRDASQQAREGTLIEFLPMAQCGDLAFFDNEDGVITHVGILLDSNTIIHASGRVHIDPIDNEGIINREINLRTHHLRIIKRF